MKELKLFVCEYCSTQYKDKKECVDCEKRHVLPLKIKDSKYQNYKDNAKGYPTQIHVEMTDGTVQIYKR